MANSSPASPRGSFHCNTNASHVSDAEKCIEDRKVEVLTAQLVRLNEQFAEQGHKFQRDIQMERERWHNEKDELEETISRQKSESSRFLYHIERWHKEKDELEETISRQKCEISRLGQSSSTTKLSIVTSSLTPLPSQSMTSTPLPYTNSPFPSTPCTIEYQQQINDLQQKEPDWEQTYASLQKEYKQLQLSSESANEALAHKTEKIKDLEMQIEHQHSLLAKKLSAPSVRRLRTTTPSQPILISEDRTESASDVSPPVFATSNLKAAQSDDPSAQTVSQQSPSLQLIKSEVEYDYHSFIHNMEIALSPISSQPFEFDAKDDEASDKTQNCEIEEKQTNSGLLVIKQTPFTEEHIWLNIFVDQQQQMISLSVSRSFSVLQILKLLQSSQYIGDCFMEDARRGLGVFYGTDDGGLDQDFRTQPLQLAQTIASMRRNDTVPSHLHILHAQLQRQNALIMHNDDDAFVSVHSAQKVRRRSSWFTWRKKNSK